MRPAHIATAAPSAAVLNLLDTLLDQKNVPNVPKCPVFDPRPDLQELSKLYEDKSLASCPTGDKSDPFALSELHLKAASLLNAGHSDSSVARALNLSRKTIYRWRNYNPNFEAELNRLRQESYSAATEKLRFLVPVAAKVLAKGLRSKRFDTRFRCAHVLLVHAAPRDVAPKSAPTNAMEIVDQFVQAERHHKDQDPSRPISPKERAQVLRQLLANLNAKEES